MQTQEAISPSLGDYVDLPALHRVGGIAKTYETLDSLRWAVRQNRARLVEVGALIIVAGRQRFHPELFEKVAIETGRTAALGRGGNHE